MTEVIERVIELFDSTCEKQFESMHCDIIKLSDAEYKNLNDAICTSIDCYSEDINICLKISADTGFLRDTMPMSIDGEQNVEPFLQDWCLELANRFLGRLKNKLLSHDCVLKMGLPSLVDCSAKRESLNEEKVSFEQVFQIVDSNKTNQIQCALFIDLLNAEMVLEDYEDEDEDWFDESELQHL